MSLNMGTPEYEPVDEIETYAFSPGWDTDMAKLLVMWPAAFLLDLTDPQLGRAGLFTAWCRSCQ